MKVHILKTLPEYFELILIKQKTFEVRKNDRDFQPEDFLILQEYSECLYTGRCITIKAGFILFGGQYGIDQEYCVISLDYSYFYFHIDNFLKNFKPE